MEISRGSKVFYRKGFTACDSSYRYQFSNPETVGSAFFFGSPSELGEVSTAAITVKATNCVSLLDNMTKA